MEERTHKISIWASIFQFVVTHRVVTRATNKIKQYKPAQFFFADTAVKFL